MAGRAPYGARGLKSRYRLYDGSGYRRAPYGARGLKCYTVHLDHPGKYVAPRMGRVD